MCGPTIVIRRGQKAGEHVYCRHCGNDAVIEEDHGKLRAVPTGQKGTPQQLEPEADLDLISELVKASVASLDNAA